MPVRKIPPNNRSITGRVASQKGGSWQHESLLEREVLFYFSLDPDVASIDTQPVRILYDGQDKRGQRRVLSYTPDILVSFRPRCARPTLLIEVKYFERLRKDLKKLRPKLKAGVRYARERGWQFKVYTERRVRGTLLDNIQFLRSYRSEEFAAEDLRRLLDTLRRLGRSTVDGLLSRCCGSDSCERGRFQAVLWGLLANHEVGVDLRAEPLSLATPIWPLAAKAQKTIKPAFQHPYL